MSGTDLARCFFSDFSMLIHSLHFRVFFVYFQIVSEDAIAILSTDIFGAISGFIGGSKAISDETFMHHVPVLATTRSLFYPPLCRYSVES